MFEEEVRSEDWRIFLCTMVVLIINKEHLFATYVELVLQRCVKGSVGGCANKFQQGLF